MGLFFNYDKPGPGVDKDAPRRRGIFLYFELLWRNFGKMFTSSMLYFVTSLPVLFLYHFIVTSVFGNIAPEMTGSVELAQLTVIFTALLAIFWGTGPVSCGYAYVMRNTAREEHVWLFSDYFQKTRESFWRGLLFLVVDMVVLLFTSVAIWTYWGMAQKSGGIFTVLFFISIFVFAIYSAMHFYIYQFEVTFSGSIISVYKNSLIMTLATLPMCILISAIIYFITTFIMSFLTPLGVILVAFLCWISFMRFAIDFYSARVIEKKLISKMKAPEEDDE